MDWNALFKAIMNTEEQVIPIFVHNPASQKITGVIMMAESIFGQVFLPLITNAQTTTTTTTTVAAGAK